jgi:sugar phosphate isomerase/epimerase
MMVAQRGTGLGDNGGEQMRLQLGVNNCFAAKRWPRPADWAPLMRDALQVDHLQLSMDLVDLDRGDEFMALQAEAIRDAAAAYGFQVHSAVTGLAAYAHNRLLHPIATERHEARGWWARAIAFASAIGAQGTGGFVGAFSAQDWRDPARRTLLWNELKRSMVDLADLAHRAGLAFFLVENLPGARELSTMDQLRQLMSDGDAEHAPVRLCLDLGHQCAPGLSAADRDPYAWLREMGRAAGVIQLQQSDAAGDQHWPFTADRNRVGRIDADRVIDALSEGGVDEGTLMLKIMPPFEEDDDDVIADITESVEYWREALERRGVLAK